MANTSFGGFRYKNNRTGGVNPRIEIMPVATGYGTALFKGDPLKRLSDGTVAQAGVGDVVVGICDGVEQYYDGVAVRRGTYLPASTSWGTLLERQSLVRVICNPDAVFEVDASAATATTEAGWQALVEENCDLVLTAGDTTSGQSNAALDTSTHATTNTLAFRIIGLSRRPDNDYTASRVKLLVVLNLGKDPVYTSTGT